MYGRHFYSSYQYHFARKENGHGHTTVNKDSRVWILVIDEVSESHSRIIYTYVSKKYLMCSSTKTDDRHPFGGYAHVPRNSTYTYFYFMGCKREREREVKKNILRCSQVLTSITQKIPATVALSAQ